MKKLLPALLTLLGAYTASAQVGIGTSTPNQSAQLEIVSSDKGVLLPQVRLTSTTDTTTITTGNVQSLLVYNTATANDVKPGYYFWYINKWRRLVATDDAPTTNGSSSPIVDNGNGTYTYVNPDGSTTTIDIPGHQTLTYLVYNPASNTLTYTNEKGINTVVDLVSLVKNAETVTTLVDNGNGTMTYTNEAGVATTISVAGGAAGVGIASTVNNGDGTFTITYTNGTTFTTSNLTGPQGPAGAAGSQGPAGAAGNGIASTVNNGNGTFTITYTDGTTFTTANFTGAQGPAGAQGPSGMAGTPGAAGVGIASAVNNGNGTFTLNFTNGSSFTTSNLTGPQGPAGATGATGATGTTGISAYQEWLNAGHTGTQADFLEALKGAQGVAGPQGPQGVQGNAGKGITTTVNNGDGTLTINYTDGTSTVINFKDIETLTTFVNNGNGTYTYTNEDGVATILDVRASAIVYNNTVSGLPGTTVQAAIDQLAAGQTAINTSLDNFKLLDNANGTFSLIGKDGTTVVSTINKGTITANADGTYTFNNGGTPVTIDPSQVHVTFNNGVYTFTNAAGTTITAIDVNANALPFNNTASGLTATTVQGALDQISAGNAAINLIDENDGKVTLVKADGTKVKVDKANIVNNNNGTYTFTNGDGTDVVINANSLSISEANGVYTFTDATGAVIETINTNASALGYNDTTTNLGSTNVQGAIEALASNQSDTDTALNNIDLVDNNDGKVTLVKADGTTVSVDKSTLTLNTNGTYTFNNGNGSPVTFDPSDVNIAETNGIYTFTNAGGTVLGAINTNASALNFNNAGTGLTATNVQAAIAEVNANVTNQVNSLELKDNQNGTISLVAPDGTDLGTVNKADLTYNVATGKYTFTNGTSGTNIQFGGGNLTSTTGDNSIVVTDGNGATLKDASIKVADGGITESKIADAAVTADKIATDAVTTSKIENGAVTNDKLNAGTAAAGTVATSNGDGTVSYAVLDASNLSNGKDLTAGDGSIVIGGTGAGALLKDADVKVADGGITTVKLNDAAVTTEKLADTAVTADKINADVAGEGLVKNTTTGKLDIADGGVTTVKLNDAAVTTSKIENGAVTNDKLNAGTAAAGTVATSNGDGTVSYAVLDASNLGNGKDLTAGDGSIVIGGTGAGALLKDADVKVADGGITTVKLNDAAVTTEKLADTAVTADKINADVAGEGLIKNTTTGKLDIADGGVTTVKLNDAAVTTSKIENGAVTNDKLNSGTAAAGTVATSNGDGTVSYELLDAASIANKGDINSTDLVVTGGDESVLKDVTLDIKAGAVTTSKLDDAAVTTAKLDNAAVTADKIATDAVTNSKIENGAVTNDKLNAGTAAAGTVATSNGDGTVSYELLDAASIANKGDINSTDLVVTGGDESVLKDVTLDIKAGAVTTSKLDDAAVTTAKLDNAAVTADKIATDAVTNSKIENGAVTNDKLNAGTAAAGTVATSNGDGTVSYELLDAASIANKGDINSTDLVVTGGDESVLKDVTLDIKAGAVTTSKLDDAAVTTAKLDNAAVTADKIATDAVTNSKIENGAVTNDKLNAGTAAAGTVATSNGDGTVSYELLDAASIANKGDINSTDLVVTGGDESVLKDVTLDIKAGAVTTAKLDDAAVTTAKLDNAAVTADKIATDAVTTSKIENGAVTNDKLNSGTAAAGTVATSNGDGTVSYELLDAASIANKGDINSTDLVVTGGDESVLKDVTLDIKAGAVTTSKLDNAAVTADKIATDAVTTSKIENGAVTNDKLNSGTAAAGTVATSNGDGTVSYELLDAASIANKGDINSTDLVVTGGDESVLKDVTLDIKAGAVTTAKLDDAAVTTAKLDNAAVTADKIATDAVTTSKIENGAVTNDKLNAGTAAAGTVATSNGDGTVSYELLDAASIANKSDINSTDLVVTGGDESVLKDVTLDIKAGAVTTAKLDDAAVTTAKLDNAAVTADKIATDAVTTSKIENGAVTNDKLNSGTAAAGTVATSNGDGTVSYELLDAASIANKGDINSTDLVVTGGDESVLKDVTLDIKAGAVTTSKLDDAAVTTAKLDNAAVTADKIATDAVTNSKIENGAVTNDKLNAGTAAAGTVATSNGDGTVSYELLDAASIANKGDINSTDLVVTGGDESVLKDVTLDIKAGAVTTAKLDDAAVTTAKLDNAAVTADKIATDAVTNSKIENGAVTNDKLNSGTAAAGTVATSNGDGTVSYELLDAASIANKGDINSTDLVVTGGDESVLKDVTLDIKAGAVTTAKLDDAAVTTAKLDNAAVTADKIATDAVTTSKIENGAVTNDKLNSGTAAAGTVATSNGDGTVSYELLDAASIANKGDINSTDLVVTGGDESVLKDVTLDIKAGAVTTAKLDDAAVISDKIATDAVTTSKIENGAVTNDKLNSGTAGAGTVATSNGDGTVSYELLDAASIANKGDINSTDLVVTGGDESVLKDVTLDIKAGAVTTSKLDDAAVNTAKLDNAAVTADKIATDAVTTSKIENGAVTNDKLNSGTAGAGTVATSNGDGTVSYEFLDAASIANKGDINSTDLVVTGGDESVLKDVTLDIKAGAVTTSKLDDAAVTTAKLDNAAVTSDKIATDAVTTSKIENGAVTNDKLNAGTAAAGTVATSDGNGNVTYAAVSTANLADKKDLISDDNSLEVVSGGDEAVLVATSLRVKAEGITEDKLATSAVTTTKLANSAVTTEKIASGGDDKVLTTAPDGTVTWADKTELAIEPWNNQNTSDKATANGSNIYQTGSIGIGNFSAENVSQKLDVKEGSVRVRDINTSAGIATDKVVVADAQGVLKTVSSMPGIRTEIQDYSAVLADETILADAAGAAVTITLPEQPVLGKKYNIKKIDTSDNKVTISGNGKTIEGLSNISGALPYQGWVLQYNGSSWFIISRI